MLNLARTPEKPQRVSRAHLMTGEGRYWEMCRRDDLDPAMYGPMMMPFALPPEFLDQGNSSAIWSMWYESMKEARQAGAKAGRRQSPDELAVIGDLRNLDPMLRLTWRLDMDLTLLSCLPAEEFNQQAGYSPVTKINGFISQFLGYDTNSVIFEAVSTSNREALAKMVEAQFPAMGRLHKAGILIRANCQNLLAIGLLQEKMKSEHLNAADKRAIKFISACLLRTLPSRIAMLVCVTTPALAGTFENECMFFGIQASDLAGGKDIWAMLPAAALETTVVGLSEVQIPFYYDESQEDESYYDRLIAQIDAEVYHASAGRGDAKRIDAIYQAFVGEFALADEAELKQLLCSGGQFYDISVPEVPEQMVRPDISLAVPGKETEMALALFELVVANYCRGGNYYDLCVLNDHRRMVENTGKRVMELSNSNSPKRQSKIEKAGQQAMQDLARGKEWFVSNLDSINAQMAAWDRFNRTVSSVS